MESKETKAKVFVDGFGGMALTDISETHADVIQALNDESIWEIFDGSQQLERGEYEITLSFWFESNFPETGGEFVTQILESKKLDSVSGTPSSRWSENGEGDPHGDTYNCERAELAMGDLSDDEMANAVFLYGDKQLSVAELMSGVKPPILYLMAAKDRIRWLSRQLNQTTVKDLSNN